MVNDPSLRPVVQKLLDDALPNDGGQHTLALGEDHQENDPLKSLTADLDRLQSHGVNTIGLEMESWFNPVLWAYQDGTLERKLGSKAMANAQLRLMFRVYSKPECADSSGYMANLCIAAMDRGLRTVAFDSRDDHLHELGNHPNTPNEQVPAEAHNSCSNVPWIYRQVQSLCTDSALDASIPNYTNRLAAIDRLISLGHQKIREGKLTSDALSATLFDALASTGNRITISGFSHIDGMGQYDHDLPSRHPNQIHGTFGEHLFALGKAKEKQNGHRVSVTQVATVGEIFSHDTHLIDREMQRKFQAPHTKALVNHKLNLIDFKKDTIVPIWHPPIDNPRSVALQEKFPLLLSPVDRGWSVERPETLMAKTKCAHINPLLMPDIKRAYDAVIAVMQPDQARLSR